MKANQEKKNAWREKTVSSCTDLGYTGYVAMACYPHKPHLFGVFSNTEEARSSEGREAEERRNGDMTYVCLSLSGTTGLAGAGLPSSRQELRF